MSSGVPHGSNNTSFGVLAAGVRLILRYGVPMAPDSASLHSPATMFEVVPCLQGYHRI